MTNNERLPALREAIGYMGGIIAFSKRMGVTHQAVYHWFRRGAVPVKHALVIERLTDIPREELISELDRELLKAAAENAKL
ncbi:MAG TPA: Cro/CI family transcriptional regulator [Terriglobales bacterium]|nr:Cro/CI family transcriptional regulator [Terriglobales bacterium]